MSVTDSITINQATNKVTVTAQGSVGLNAGGQIDGNLEVTGTLAVGGNQLGKDVRFWGETANKYFLWDASQDKVIITGDLQVDGTTTTINSTVVSIADPVFSLGGTSVPTSSDSKDRGIEHFYYDTAAGAGKRGFFGYSNADNAYKFLTDCPDPSGAEIFTGTAGNLVTGGITASGDVVISASNSRFEVIDTDSSLKTVLAAGDSLGTVGTYTNHPFHIRTNTLSAIVVDTSQRVGIGTAAPSQKLTVTTSSINDGVFLETSQPVTYAKLFNSNSESFPVGNLNLGYGPNFPAVIQALSNRMSLKGGHTTGGQISFSSSSSEIMRMTSSGLGIGTTAPAAALHVSKDSGGAISEVAHFVGGGSTDDKTQITVGGNTSSALVSFGFRNTGSGFGYIANASDAEVLTIDGGNSRVGIGTTAPSELMHIYGAGPTCLVESTGNSGVFEVSTSAGDVRLGKADGYAFLAADQDGDDIRFFLNPSGGGGLDTKVIFKQNGNVGIGTTSPAYKLDVDGDIRVLDGHHIYAGDSTDLQVYHNGTNSVITNATGNLFIENTANGNDIIFNCDDGSGGTAAYITIDGSGTRTNFHKNVKIEDSVTLGVGNGFDLSLLHDGTDSFVQNASGDLTFIQNADAKDIIFQSDDGSGGTETYFQVDGGREEVVAKKPLIQTPGTVDPANNGELAFTVVSNTSIKVKYKGDDGTVRSTTLTLS